MKHLKILLLGIFIVCIISVVAFFTVKTGQEFKYKEKVSGIEFVSNTTQPLDYLHKIREKRYYFILSAEMDENNSQLNQKMAQAITLYNAILFANKRTLITVLAVYDDQGLAYCQTNYGNVRINTKISADECQKMLTQLDSNILIKIKKPMPLAYNRVIVEPPIITVIPKSLEEIQNLNYLLLKAMFPNADKAINIVNKKLEKING